MSAEGKEAFLEFMQCISSAPEGTRFEMGEMYDLAEGWRCYLRIGEKGLAISARQARKFADHFENMSRRPEWASQKTWALEQAETLRACATVVVRNNRDRRVPEGYAEQMPTEGSA